MEVDNLVGHQASPRQALRATIQPRCLALYSYATNAPPDYEKPSHWDFMLELGTSLATWELQELPASWAKLLNIQAAAKHEIVPAIQLPDHRLAYLSLEGPLSRNRGTVQQCDFGSYELLTQQEGLYEFRIQGAKLKCKAKLSSSETNWQLKIDPSQ